MNKRKQLLGFELLEGRRVFAAAPVITEFMASNDGALLDGYGAAQDWIEIYNAGDESIDLAGYSLTDNAGDLDRWTFPSVTLGAGEYAVVFASSRDEVDPAGGLHTNFGLSDEGEYLALVDPLGVIVSEYAAGGADYPAQHSNASYGVAFDTTFIEVVGASSTSKYFIPTDASVDAAWMLPGFDASSWSSGRARLGYEATPASYADIIQTTLPLGTQSAYVRIPFTVSDADAVLSTLRIRYDDGFVAYLNGVEIARRNAPETIAYDSEATEFRPREAAVIEEVLNISPYTSALQLGSNVLAFQLLDSPEGHAQDLLLAPSLIISSGAPVSSGAIGGMISPTPGGPNTNVVASEVEFSRPGGVFATPFALSLSSTGPGEIIRYTVNGTDPTPSSAVYTGPINITYPVQVRARAFGADGQVGRVRMESYTPVNSALANFTSDLPIIVLENYGAGFPERAFADAMFALYEPDELTGRSALSDQATLTSPIGQHKRGHSTYNQAKPNLRVEFRDETGQSRNVELLGMPAESDWILYAPYKADRSLLRNAVMYDFSGQVVDYAVRTRFVEVFANVHGGALDPNDYYGVYVLMENVKRDDNRVAIEELTPANNEPSDITGGYIIKIDRSDFEEDDAWDVIGTPSQPQLVHVDPERREMTQAQVDYIRGYVGDFEAALYGPDWKDPQVGYAAYLDVDAYIDHHLLRAFAREKDILIFSEHYYKAQGGKLTAGPAWDFDLSSGSEGSFVIEPQGWRVDNQNELKAFQYGWAARLFSDPDFMQRWIDRWNELREATYSDANLTATVLRHAAVVEEAQARNAERWPDAAPDGGPNAAPELQGWDAEVSNLVNWLIARAAWVDQQMVAAPSIATNSAELPLGGEVVLTNNHGSGEIYYTLDGSDPRASGGGVSPTAILYSGPIAVTAGMTVNARAFSTTGFTAPFSGWSGLESKDFVSNYPLRIVELYYNPSTVEEHEFIELLNTGTTTISLDGVQIRDFISEPYVFANGLSLGPGERIVVARNPADFTAHFGSGVKLAPAGYANGNLSNGGEAISLYGPDGELLQSFMFDDAGDWPTSPDGGGYSLEYVGPLAAGEDPAAGSPDDPFDNPANWRASLTLGGTPGTGDPPGPDESADFNDDDSVDGRDFLRWQRNLGKSNADRSEGDANSDGVVDGSDLNVWKSQFGDIPASVISLVSNAVAPPPAYGAAFWIVALELPAAYTRQQSAVGGNDAAEAETVEAADEFFAQLTREAMIPDLAWESIIRRRALPADDDCTAEDNRFFLEIESSESSILETSVRSQADPQID